MKIKFVTLILLLTVINTASFSQKIKLKKGIATVNNEYFCKYRKNIDGISILDKNKNELFYFNWSPPEYPESEYIKVNVFSENKDVFFIPSVGFGKYAIRLLYNNRAMVNDKINQAGVDKIKQKYSINTGGQTVVIVNNSNSVVNANYQMVERRRNMPILIFDETIEQDHENIGTIQIETKSENGTLVDYVKVYTNNAVLVAQGHADRNSEQFYTIFTSKDNKRHSINVGHASKNEAKKIISKYLIDNYYL